MKNFVAFISLIVLVFLLIGCGKGNTVLRSGADYKSAASGTGGIEAYQPPGDVDPDVFEMLRDEFLKALGEYPERTSASAPMGEAGRVTDLAYDPGTGLLTWTYVNLGDYNLSGDVSIADVAEVARYYLADSTDGEGDDSYEAWVDGSGDGEVNIADVAPLAQNYLNEVAEYAVLTSETPQGEYTEIGRVDFSEAKTPSTIGAATSTSPEIEKSIVEAGLSNPALPWRTGQSALQIQDGDKTPSQKGTSVPKMFEVLLPADAQQFIAVQPVDSADNPGGRSAAVEYPWAGAVQDSIFLLARWLGAIRLDLDGNPATPAVDTDVIRLSVYGWTAAGKPLAALDTLRISMLKTDATFYGSSPGGYFLDNAYDGDLAYLTPPQPATFFELGMVYGGNTFELDDYGGVLTRVLLLPPGGATTFTTGTTIAFDIVGDDGSKFGRTYYTDLSASPGESRKVIDLAFDRAAELLTWSYVNLGDYSLDGGVWITDVVEFARFYLADATDGEGDDLRESWVDGTGDGEVNIADFALFVKNIMNEVAEYVILTSDSADGEYTEIGRVGFGEPGVFPKTFEVPLPEGALAYIAVSPADSSGILGTQSNVVNILSEEPPVPPASLEASDGISRMITLTWTKSEGAHGYKIYRDSQDAPVVTVGDVDTWDDTSLGDFELHTYWMKATNAAGMSDFSESDTGYVGELQPQPVMRDKHHFATLGKDYGAGVTSAYEFTIP